MCYGPGFINSFVKTLPFFSLGLWATWLCQLFCVIFSNFAYCALNLWLFVCRIVITVFLGSSCSSVQIQINFLLLVSYSHEMKDFLRLSNRGILLPCLGLVWVQYLLSRAQKTYYSKTVFMKLHLFSVCACAHTGTQCHRWLCGGQRTTYSCPCSFLLLCSKPSHYPSKTLSHHHSISDYWYSCFSWLLVYFLLEGSVGSEEYAAFHLFSSS